MVDVKVLNIREDPIGYVASETLDVPGPVLIVFPTARNIRSFHKILGRMAGDGAVRSPDCFEVNGFVTRCLDAGGRGLVSRSLRPFYLQQAMQRVDRERLDQIFRGSTPGLQEDFMEFAATGARILRFFDEMYAEKITTSRLAVAALYTDYEKHMAVLEEVAGAYRSVLEEHGLTDPMFLKMDGAVHTGWLERYGRLYFLVGGYLTRFETDLLKDIAERCDIEIILRYEGAPDEQVNRIFHTFDAEPVTVDTAPLPQAVDIRAFEEAAGQFGFIISSIERALNAGIGPDEIVVVLPDENLKRILAALDRRRIFNYAMGLDLRDTVWYSFLTVLNALFADRVDHAYRAEHAIAFLKHPFIMNLRTEEAWIDDVVGKIKERNRLVLGEGDFCRPEAVRDVFSEARALMTKERGYAEFVTALASFLDRLFTTMDESFIESLSRSPDFLEARKALMNFLYQSASMPYGMVYRATNPVKHMGYLLSEAGRLRYNDVAGGDITVMGMLETRNLSFRAVIIPDMNEEFIPPRNEKEMFLNTPIRESVGIPTYRDRENLARHYFMSLVKNADMVFLSYVERDDRPIRSRFIEEILIERGHTGEDPAWLRQRREFESLVFDARPVKAAKADIGEIPKEEAVIGHIRSRGLSPSMLETYRLCSYRFYLAHVKNIREPVELTEELTARELGNILHDALRAVYSEKKVFSSAGELAERIREAVTAAASRYDVFKVSAEAEFQLEVIRDKLFRFAESEVKRFEEGWTPHLLEENMVIDFDGIRLSGRIDRVDTREIGGKREAFIIDYKYRNVARLRNIRYDESFTAFQLPLYRLILENERPDLEIEGMGYYDIRDDFRLVAVKEHGTAGDFRRLLEEAIREILSPDVPFIRTDDLKTCTYCTFAGICGRK